MITSPFEQGHLYRRRTLHQRFGGQQQGGIATPTGAPFLLLFTGESGEAFGYNDGWMDSGLYRFVGEGQRGNMSFVRGNSALRDHAAAGKTLHLFQTRGKGKDVRYLGEFALDYWEWMASPDADQRQRQVIAFFLRPIGGALTDVAAPVATASLEVLRALALEAAASPRAPGKQGTRTLAERSAIVAQYVLARARGTCESCLTAAPFHRTDGSPYLEVHHTQLISEGGPDHPHWVGAVCPNCHRCIHYGADGAQLNARLMTYLNKYEPLVKTS